MFDRYEVVHSDAVYSAGNYPPVPSELWVGWYVFVEDGEPMWGPFKTREEAEDQRLDLLGVPLSASDKAKLGARLLGHPDHAPEEVK